MFQLGSPIGWFRCLFFIAILLNALPAQAQIPEKQFYFKHLRPQEGLTSGIINDLFRDRRGNLWIATYGGLNCFDGQHIKVWKADPFRPGNLANNSVHSICEDLHGDIWAATESGISRFDHRTFKTYHLTNRITGKDEISQSFEILLTRKGQLVTYTHSGVYIFDTLQQAFKHYPVEPETGKEALVYVFKSSFTEDPIENAIWIGSPQGVSRFDLDDYAFTNKDNDPNGERIYQLRRVHPISTDNDGRLVFHVNTSKGLLCTYDPKTKALDSLSTKDWMEAPIGASTIFVDKANNKWISTWNYRLFFQEARTGRVYSFKHDNANSYSVSANFFWDVYQDKDETVFLGTIDGLSFVNLRSSFFSIVPFPEGEDHLTDYFGSSILNVDHQDRVWIAPNFTHLLCYDTKAGAYSRFDILKGKTNSFGKQCLVNCMEPTADTLYFGTDNGIYTFDVRSEVFSPLKDIPQEEYKGLKNIKIMHLAPSGDLWFAMEWRGVIRYNINTHKWKHYLPDSTDQSAFPPDLVYDIHVDANGTVWFLTGLSGLVKYNPARDAFEFPFRERKGGMPLGVFTTMLHDRDNVLWMSNDITGLARYNPQTSELVLDYRELGLDGIHFGGMLMDGQGHLWLNYYSKYTLFNPKTKTVEHFDIDYSLDDYQYLSTLMPMQDGKIVAESRNAIILFRPDVRRTYRMTDPVTMSNFVTEDSLIPFLENGSQVSLRHWQNFFSIDFSTIGYLKEPNLRFAYKLEGFDPDWVESGERQTAYYTNVPGGNYIFKVKVKDINGSWIESDAVIHVHIGRIFYKTIWFRVALATIFVLLVVWYIRLWQNGLRKKSYEQAVSYFANSRYSSNNVDDILWDIAHNVITRTDLVDCVIYLFDEQNEFLVQKAAFGGKNPEAYVVKNPIRIPLGKGIVGKAAQSGAAVIVTDTRQDPTYIPDEAPMLSEIAVPILHEGKVLGVIDSEHPRKRFFNRAHQELFEDIARITGDKIANARREVDIREKEKRLEALQIQVSETRQLALRAQMNPHFIFNCLNSINAFILENDADTASTYLIKFAKLIRLILENSNLRLIPLQSELDALRLYIEMEALRFDKRFAYAIEVGPEVRVHDTTVPPLILQPFVENAIWHGLLHKDGPGALWVRIKVEGERLVFVIEDNGVGRDAALEFRSKSSTKKKSLGMELTMERLELINEQDNRNFKLDVSDRILEDGSKEGTIVRIAVDI